MKELFIPRYTIFTKKLLQQMKDSNTQIYQHNGYKFMLLEEENKRYLNNHLLGHNLGQFSLTKKLGKKIHNSERNKKRKDKLLNKKKK